jgi:small subunit ribosomal protein S1
MITTPTLAQTEEQQKNGNGRSPFLQLIEQYDYPQPKRGDILQGNILRIEEDVIFVDVGSKRDAVVPYEEVSQLGDELLDSLTLGKEVSVYVTETPVGDQLLVSLERGLQKLDWEKAEKAKKQKDIVELEVINHNKGGLVVKFGRLQGFVPNSHAPGIPNLHDARERQSHKASLHGTTVPLKIIEIDPQRERLVLSAKAVQQEQQRQHLQALTPGQKVTGKVGDIKKYGAFVDIGQGLTGLLHISQIAWEHLDHPAAELTPGQELELLIDDVDVERNRISLNRKALLPGPWQQFAAAHEAGDLVEGEVVSLVDFGAFIKLPSGIEGLLHHSEMHTPNHGSVSDELHRGDEVLVRIINIDLERERLSLSMRRVSAAEEISWMAAKNQGAQHNE